MPNENPNDFQWKNNLEDVSSLSAETLTDKNATWEKLYNRLRQKPRRIKAVWYWAAAASLLLVLIISALTVNKKQVNLVTHAPAQTSSKKITAPVISPSRKIDVVYLSPSLTEKKKIIKQANHKKPPANDIAKQEQTAPDINDQTEIKPVPEISPAIVDRAVETMLIVAPSKKKLKVVHINELGGPLEEASTIVRYYERRSFQLKLFNPQIYTTTSLPQNNTGFTFFKRKTPSN